MPKQMCFLILFFLLFIYFFFTTLHVIFLNFLWWNLPKFSQHIAFCRIQILNTKKVGFVQAVFFLFLQVYVKFISFTAVKQAPTKVNYLLPVCQILQNFTEGKARKFTVSFAFCAHVDVIEIISKNTRVFLQGHPDYLSFRPQHTFNRKTIGSHLKLQCCTLWLGTCLQM